VYVNLSNGGNIRGPWNQGQGPWCEGEQWNYVEHPQQVTAQRAGSAESQGSKMSVDDAQELDRRLSQERSQEVLSSLPKGQNSWENFPKDYVSSAKSPSSANTRQSQSRAS
jgi:Mn-containing catalase